MNTLTYIFLATLFAGSLLQLWLLRRHERHVMAHRDQVPAVFAEKIPLADHQKAADYTCAKVRLASLDLRYGILILLAWTVGGGLNWLLQLWQQLGWSPVLTGITAILSVLLIQGALELPLTLWRVFLVEAGFGFNRTTPSRFVKDLALQILLTLLIGVPLIWVVLWLMEASGGLWWLYAWAVWLGFSLFMTWAYPTFIAPLFNKFTPLEKEELKERVEQLLTRCGFRSNGIFVMDGSRRSAHGNAYFTGFGRNKRIVFFDTLLQGIDSDELEAILAHELGHFKRRHVLKRLLVAAATSFLGFWLLGWLIGQPWFYQGLGVTVYSNAAALILFAMAAPVFTQFLAPLSSMLMRKQEFEADDFAVEQTGGETLIRALVKLYKDNASTLTPDALYSAFHDSHPPAPVRIAHISTRMASN